MRIYYKNTYRVELPAEGQGGAMMNFIPIIRSFHQKDFCLCDGLKILPWMSELTHPLQKDPFSAT